MLCEPVDGMLLQAIETSPSSSIEDVVDYIAAKLEHCSEMNKHTQQMTIQLPRVWHEYNARSIYTTLAFHLFFLIPLTDKKNLCFAIEVV